MRFVVTLFIALIVLSALQPWLQKLGIGRLPGDFRFRLFGRQWFLPFGSSVLIGLIGMAIARFL